MQVIGLSMGCVGNRVREGQYSGEGALRWPSERATEVELMTVLGRFCVNYFPVPFKGLHTHRHWVPVLPT